MTLTEEIFKDNDCPYDNPYQRSRTYPKWLFVCSAGLLRSATGANYYAKKGYNTRSCGTDECALIPLSVNLIQWADKIIFVNKYNAITAEHTFHGHWILPTLMKKQVVLDIPDKYAYNDVNIIRAFTKALGDEVPQKQS